MQMPPTASATPGEYALDRFELPDSVRERLKEDVALAKRKAEGADALEGLREMSRRQKLEHQFGASPARQLDDLGQWRRRPRARGLVRVVDPSEVDRFACDINTRQSGMTDRKRVAGIVKKIRIAGAWKRSLQLPVTWRSDLEELEVTFPNFREVLDFLRATLALAELARIPVKWTPLLFDGPPGLGKTYFADELATRLRVPYRRLDMSVAHTSAGLVGSDKSYDGSHVGLVFEMLAFGDSASPLIVLDELDKASGDDRFPVMGALFGLLEPRTAANYRDQSIPEIQLDAGHVLWTATSNEANAIPEPIRSRMRQFSIPGLSADAARAVVTRMYRSTGAELMPGVELPDLEDAVIAILTSLSPRTAQLSLREAFGRAAFEHRHFLAAKDFPVIKSGPRKPGFI